MKKEIILKGNGFTIRPYRKEDYVSITENANNKAIARNLQNGFPSPYTEKDAKNWIKINLKNYKKGIYHNFVIEVDGKAVGSIGSTSKGSFKMGFGYWLGKKYWGKGIATEAVGLYLKHFFKTYKKFKELRRLHFHGINLHRKCC